MRGADANAYNAAAHPYSNVYSHFNADDATANSDFNAYRNSNVDCYSYTHIHAHAQSDTNAEAKSNTAVPPHAAAAPVALA